MYSQYIPHFPTLWLTKDERSLLYKYFILNPSLCCISSIVSSHLQILYIVQKKCWSRQKACACRQPSSSRSCCSAARERLGVRIPPFAIQVHWPGDLVMSSQRAGCGHPATGPRGMNSGRSRSKKHACGLPAEDGCAPDFSPWPGWERESKNASLLSKRFTNSPVTLSQGETVSAGEIR